MANGIRRRAAEHAFLLTVAILAAAVTPPFAQTAPDAPEVLTPPIESARSLLAPTLDQATDTPAAATSRLLAAAPLTGPIYASYARGDFEPPVATNLSTAPGTVEVRMVAVPAIWEFTPGVPTLVWTFNGTVPGPTIEANVGDTVIVHFTNSIDTPMSIHWHGVEVPATMDGSHVSAPPLARGESFDYVFKVSRASLFWYHPHHMSAEQVERGLYGALLVHDPAADRALGLPANERLLVLDDALLDGDGQFSSFTPIDPVDRAAYETNGRQGNVLLVNGRAHRVLPVEPGVPVRFRMVDVANTRFMRLNVPGRDFIQIGSDGGLLETAIDHPPIGQVVDPDPTHGGAIVSDGDPSHGLLMTPGERIDAVLTPTGASGDLLPVEWHDWGRGYHFYYKNSEGHVVLIHVHSAYPSLPPQQLFALQIAGNAASPPAAWAPPPTLRAIPALDVTAAPVLKLTMGHGLPDDHGNISFWMQQTNRLDPTTALPFPLIDSTKVNKALVGETAVWEVTNTAHGDHNFHTHGFEFQPLSIDYYTCDPTTLTGSYYVKSDIFPPQEKDTVRMPGPPMPPCFFNASRVWTCPMCQPGTAFTRLRAAVKFDAAGRENDIEAYGFDQAAGVPSGHSGGWMVHCHLLEHPENGMMTYFELRNP